MKVIKKFDTEEEFEEWLNSPNKRTPYTCFVKSSGKVYFEERNLNDYSVTLIVRDDGWVRLFGGVSAPWVNEHGEIYAYSDYVKSIEVNGKVIYDENYNSIGEELMGHWYYLNEGIRAQDHKANPFGGHRPSTGERKHLYCKKK